MSLYEEYRGRGIGTEMMKEMFNLLRSKGIKRVSLSVQKANYANKMYEKLGFKVFKDNGEEFVMYLTL